MEENFADRSKWISSLERNFVSLRIASMSFSESKSLRGSRRVTSIFLVFKSLIILVDNEAVCQGSRKKDSALK